MNESRQVDVFVLDEIIDGIEDVQMMVRLLLGHQASYDGCEAPEGREAAAVLRAFHRIIADLEGIESSVREMRKAPSPAVVRRGSLAGGSQA